MTHRDVSKVGFPLLLAVVSAMLSTGCRHEETVAISNVDPGPAAVVADGDPVPVEAVTPVPYRQPVPAQPQASAPSAPATRTARPVLAQYPAPTRQAAPTPPRPEPELVTIPVGTIVRVRIDDHLSSHTSRIGQPFNGTVTQDIAAQGRVAVRSGDRVIGRVTEAEPAQKIGGRARLSLDFETLEVSGGQQRPLSAQFAQTGKSQTAKDAAIIGGSTIGGAIIGEAIEDGEGGVIGAIVGGLGGAYAAKKTKAKPVEIPAGTVVDLELTQPVTLEIYPG